MARLYLWPESTGACGGWSRASGPAIVRTRVMQFCGMNHVGARQGMPPCFQSNYGHSARHKSKRHQSGCHNNVLRWRDRHIPRVASLHPRFHSAGCSSPGPGAAPLRLRNVGRLTGVGSTSPRRCLECHRSRVFSGVVLGFTCVSHRKYHNMII